MITRKTKIVAPGKIRAKKRRQEAQRALEADAGEIEVRASAQGRPAVKFSMGELKGVITNTLKRVYDEEFQINVDEKTVKEVHAHEIARELRYGGRNSDGYMKLDGGLPMKEHEYASVPRCKGCRD